jgi:hypothetical protein
MIVNATKGGVKPFPEGSGTGRVRVICGRGCSFTPSSDPEMAFEITSDSFDVVVDKSNFTVFGFDRPVIIEEIP